MTTEAENTTSTKPTMEITLRLPLEAVEAWGDDLRFESEFAIEDGSVHELSRSAAMIAMACIAVDAQIRAGRRAPVEPAPFDRAMEVAFAHWDAWRAEHTAVDLDSDEAGDAVFEAAQAALASLADSRLMAAFSGLSGSLDRHLESAHADVRSAIHEVLLNAFSDALEASERSAEGAA